ncbi:MAG TPA: GNAT family protein [Pyrinomonadaceae bacterium]|jgi:ribosomal-protein-alanine N-acetyltransferase
MNEKNPLLRVKGKTIYLRYLRAEDAAEFIALNRTSRGFHRGLVTPPVDEAGYEKFLSRNESETNESFLICQNGDDKIVGSITLSQIFRGNFCNAYLGYFLGADFAGKGFMTEAISLTLRYAFKDLKLHRVEANVQPENLASIAVLKKNGFTKEGFSRRYLKIDKKWRDHERWAIIAEDWRKNDSGSNRKTYQ